ncbi:3-isopropylmalate dehydrogenase [Vulcanimicrobium alpinum]|uniref:3-isopropylmalate dehydrogenase n=1 Tax=Vulcanimicrobium alpinum TaxID=3016050 RepID=A0AAN1XZC9_UNVUL|nr:3-isopropylmalate dehydrogenase [Vulcanimicrobium alpinum]BDE07734.1 3-isopropylmalate dehydrogenase [Vulcanimicrobium alpinum]
MTHRIAVLPGDGIGPEVTAAAVQVLGAALPECTFREAAVGAAAIASHGTPLPQETIALGRESDAILFGAVGGPGFDDVTPEKRPEAAILGLRKAFGLYANLRPAFAFAGLESRSPLRAELVRGLDLVIVRELTGGLYFGPKSLEREDGVLTARDTLVYRDFEIERIARVAFDLARARRKHVTSVDKSNVLVSSQLWRRIVGDVAREYPDVTLAHMLVDNAAMQLVRDPRAFDVIVTENLFGDILSDEAAMVTGTIGTAASASLGGPPSARGFGLYEPISGTAPDIVGRGIANPAAAILSAAMLARFSLGETEAAERIERAVAATLAEGPRTADLSDAAPATSTEFTAAVIARCRAESVGARPSR